MKLDFAKVVYSPEFKNLLIEVGDGLTLTVNKGLKITDEDKAMAEEVAKRINEYDDLYAALVKARQDINWMLNNQQLLNPQVFDYIDAALAKVDGE